MCFFLPAPPPFLSTPSARRATPRGVPAAAGWHISIHALREEGDGLSAGLLALQRDFYPRPPRGGRLAHTAPGCPCTRFLSTPSARRATRWPDAWTITVRISIHALREEGDLLWAGCLCLRSYFYPRPPRGGRQKHVRTLIYLDQFLSTPSARRATCNAERSEAGQPISIHALREEGDFGPGDYNYTINISIHALREEGDAVIGGKTYPEKAFLSTPSARRATASRRSALGWIFISIHALREEGDHRMTLLRTVSTSFLSTPSARRATMRAAAMSIPEPDFYPRPPRGGRQQKQRDNTLLLSHYTHPCTNCKEVSVKQAIKLHRYLHSRPLFQCEASRKTMCTVCSHWPDIKRSARCPVQTLGEVQRVRPWSGSCCPVGRTADCLRRGRSGRSAPP